MAALLVAIAVMSVLMSAALPAWRHQAVREKEAELVFRGEQYVRAIALWERRMGPGSRPPSLDVLVTQKFLRKKYKDPITGGDFQPVMAGAAISPENPGAGGRQGGPPGGRQGGPPGGRQGGPQFAQPQPVGPGPGGGIGAPGIFGVRSRSTENSIRIYKGATQYSQWRFDHAGAAMTPGGVPGQQMPGGVGAPMPGGRMGPGGGRMGPGGMGRGGRMGPGGSRGRGGFPEGQPPAGGRGRGQ